MAPRGSSTSVGLGLAVLLVLGLHLSPTPLAAANPQRRVRHQQSSASASKAAGAKVKGAPVTGYAGALGLALQFFEGQRSGKLDAAQQTVTWRGDSGLTDGKDVGVDLVGGYYVSADNTKAGFPMAFSVTMLAWSLLEYGSQLSSAVGAPQLAYATAHVKWGTDYFLKASQLANTLWVQVGDFAADTACWERPEDMDTSRAASAVNVANPGSDVAAETAAALASASLVFKTTNATYSATLLARAVQLFTFAGAYQGAYSDSITNQYPSLTGFQDELIWAAAWLYRATGDAKYLSYLVTNDGSLQGSQVAVSEISWDNKFAAAQILLAKLLLGGITPKDSASQKLLAAYKANAEAFVCGAMPSNPQQLLYITPGGNIFVRSNFNSQYLTSTAFALLVYADALAAAGASVSCIGAGGSSVFGPQDLIAFAKSQIDYLLGSNPMGISLMVGYGSAYPQFVHHRGASIVSIKTNAAPVGCQSGIKDWLLNPNPNPNIHNGAIVGGPDVNNVFSDNRSAIFFNAPALFINAPAVGALARISALPAAAPNPPRPPPSPPSPPPPPPSPSPPPPPPIGKDVAIGCSNANSWFSSGVQYIQWNCLVNNTNPTRPVVSVSMICSNVQPAQAWNFFPENCTLASYTANVPPLKSTDFGMIQDAAVGVPTFTIVSYTLGPGSAAGTRGSGRQLHEGAGEADWDGAAAKRGAGETGFGATTDVVGQVGEPHI